VQAPRKACRTQIRACHSKHVADDPQQYRVTIDIDRVVDPIDLGGKGHRDPLTPTLTRSNSQQPEPAPHS
jgi:hypothetical protein